VCYIQTNLRDESFQLNGLSKTVTLSNLHVDSVNQKTLLFEQEQKSNYLNCRLRYHQKYFDSGLLNGLVETYRRLYVEMLEDLIAFKTNKSIQDYSLLAKRFTKTSSMG
jgi:hypothetical protein